MKIEFEQYGEGFPIVLLHAFPLSRKMWTLQIKPIVEAGFRLILPDLRGFGETNSFADINTMEDMANDVAELLENLKIEQAIVGGLSMGGYAAFNLFRSKPEIFKALILCDTNCAPDTKENRQNRFNLIENIEEAGSQALIDKLLPKLIGEFTEANNQNLVSELNRLFSEANPQAAIAALRGMAERPDLCFLLSEIEVPTIFIFGEDDKLINVEIAQKMHDKVRNSQLSIIKKAGHYSNLEQPGHFNEAFISFIKQLNI